MDRWSCGPPFPLTPVGKGRLLKTVESFSNKISVSLNCRISVLAGHLLVYLQHPEAAQKPHVGSCVKFRHCLHSSRFPRPTSALAQVALERDLGCLDIGLAELRQMQAASGLWTVSQGSASPTGFLFQEEEPVLTARLEGKPLDPQNLRLGKAVPQRGLPEQPSSSHPALTSSYSPGSSQGSGGPLQWPGHSAGVHPPGWGHRQGQAPQRQRAQAGEEETEGAGTR